MARPLGYTPPPVPDTSVDVETGDLMKALQQGGLLRALTGATRSYPALLKVAMEQIDPKLLRSAIELTGAARDLDPEGARRLAIGLRNARGAAQQASRGAPEGPLALLRRLRDPNTRRGLSATLAAMAAVGAALGDKDPGAS